MLNIERAFYRAVIILVGFVVLFGYLTVETSDIYERIFFLNDFVGLVGIIAFSVVGFRIVKFAMLSRKKNDVVLPEPVEKPERRCRYCRTLLEQNITKCSSCGGPT